MSLPTPAWSPNCFSRQCSVDNTESSGSGSLLSARAGELATGQVPFGGSVPGGHPGGGTHVVQVVEVLPGGAPADEGGERREMSGERERGRERGEKEYDCRVKFQAWSWQLQFYCNIRGLKKTEVCRMTCRISSSVSLPTITIDFLRSKGYAISFND